MECVDCQRELKGGFGVGPEPYKAFRCFACVMRNLAERRRDEAEQEAAYYLAKLNELWDICMPNRRGHYRRGLGSIVLNHVSDACGYSKRKYVLTLQDDDGRAVE